MTTPKAKLAGLALIAALSAGFTLGLTAPAGAGYKEGFLAYDRGDYATALREWRPLAEQGNARAQFFLGVMYRYGLGVPQDDAEASGWWRKAAEQEHAGAQYSIGLMYDKGLGVPQDYAKALFWYRKALPGYREAAEWGVADAQYDLGRMYDKGQGVPQDFAEAVKWYRKAADQGYAEAQHNLGLMYYKGQGVTQDYVQAHVWINLAVPKLPPGEGRDKAVKVRDLLPEMMTPAQISEAQKLAREWRQK